MIQMKTINLLFLTLLLGAGISAQELPPAPSRLVTDLTGTLSAQQTQHLEQKLVNYNDTTSTQIAVLITTDLQGYDITDFAQRIGQAWGVGQKGKDNGVVIVVKPKTASSSGLARVEIGYGLEPVIPDITARHIVDYEMIPHFRNDDYFSGLDAGTDVVMAMAAGQFSADEYEKRNSSGGGGLFIPILILIIVIVMIRRSKGGYYNTGKSSLPLWTALWLGSSLGRGQSGSWNNFNSGSGGFGGGGGGFGGFGGGGFGGGGASGSW